MKTLLLTIAIVAGTVTAVQAQVNTDVKEVTTTQKVVEKGTDVKTKVVKKTETEKEILEVEGNDQQDQNAKIVKQKSDDLQVIEDNVSIDAENSDKRQQNMQQQQMNLQASIKAEKDKAEKERQMLLEKKAAMQRELEERRAALEARPKGMAKLKKDDK